MHQFYALPHPRLNIRLWATARHNNDNACTAQIHAIHLIIIKVILRILYAIVTIIIIDLISEQNDLLSV